MEVVHLTVVTPAATDDAGDGLGQAAHTLPHLQAVVGGHGCRSEATENCSTGQRKLNWSS